MSRFIKQLFFGEEKSLGQSHKVANQSIHQQNKMPESVSFVNDTGVEQEKRIIQLEIIAGSLLGIIRENNLIDDDELRKILDLAESEANISTQSGKKKAKKYRYHS